MNSFVIFPPLVETSIDGPYLSCPIIASYLRKHGLDVEYIDLNIEFISYFYCDMIKSPNSVNELQYLLYKNALKNDIKEKTKFSRFLPYLVSLLPIEKQRLSAITEVEYLPQKSKHILKKIFSAKRIRSLCPDINVWMFSVLCVDQLPYLAFIIKLIKTEYNNAIILTGGAFFNLLDPKMIENFKNKFSITEIFQSDSEFKLLKFLSKLKNISINVMAHNTFFINQVSNLNIKFNMSQYTYSKNIIPIYISIGCNWAKCTFCDYTRVSSSTACYKIRPIDEIVNQIKNYILDGYTKFYLISDSPTYGFLTTFAKTIIQENIKIEFSCFLRISPAHDKSFFTLLKKAGVDCITFGVESFINRILILMKKGFTSHIAIKNIIDANTAGCKCIINQIYDFPTISVQEIHENLQILWENIGYIYKLNWFSFCLSPFSGIMQELDVYNITPIAGPVLSRQIGLEIPFENDKTINWEIIKMKYIKLEKSILRRFFLRRIIENNDISFLKKHKYNNKLYITNLENGKTISIRKDINPTNILIYMKKFKTINNIFNIFMGNIYKIKMNGIAKNELLKSLLLENYTDKEIFISDNILIKKLTQINKTITYTIQLPNNNFNKEPYCPIKSYLSMIKFTLSLDKINFLTNKKATPEIIKEVKNDIFFFEDNDIKQKLKKTYKIINYFNDSFIYQELFQNIVEKKLDIMTLYFDKNNYKKFNDKYIYLLSKQNFQHYNIIISKSLYLDPDYFHIWRELSKKIKKMITLVKDHISFSSWHTCYLKTKREDYSCIQCVYGDSVEKNYIERILQQYSNSNYYIYLKNIIKIEVPFFIKQGILEL